MIDMISMNIRKDIFYKENVKVQEKHIFPYLQKAAENEVNRIHNINIQDIY